jgi:hypothetical protein
VLYARSYNDGLSAPVANVDGGATTRLIVEGSSDNVAVGGVVLVALHWSVALCAESANS